jgi:hypothetical protein
MTGGAAGHGAGHGGAGRRLTLRVLPGTYAICRLAPDAAPPAWVFHDEAGFLSVTRTPHETSVVCAEDDVPPAVTEAERGWRALEVGGPIPLRAIGVIAALAEPLARAGVPVFAVSTHDTDYLLVPGERLPHAIEALRRAVVVEVPPGWPPDAIA